MTFNDLYFKMVDLNKKIYIYIFFKSKLPVIFDLSGKCRLTPVKIGACVPSFLGAGLVIFAN